MGRWRTPVPLLGYFLELTLGSLGVSLAQLAERVERFGDLGERVVSLRARWPDRVSSSLFGRVQAGGYVPDPPLPEAASRVV